VKGFDTLASICWQGFAKASPVRLIDQITERLTQVSETPALEAQVLLAHILGRQRSWVLAHPEICLSPEQSAELESRLTRLENCEPLPYVLQHREFFGLDFSVSPKVLIPRPETELLVEQALDWLRANPGRRSALDVGTGSGCIALALAVNVPDLHILASDISSEALAQAGENLDRIAGQARVEFILADLIPAVREPVDIICANLPYIPSDELAKLKVAGWEPRIALDGGPDGLSLIRRFLEQAPASLAPGGLLLMEIEAGQGEAALDLAGQAFPRAEIILLQDLAGRDRLVRIRN
jgi:release factor glutamine methyltransferase